MNHSHYLYDSDPHFKIDPITRKIINNSSSKITLIQHDHNSERFTFEVPRHIEGHDLLNCNMVEIHYVNVESNTKVVRAGVYTVDDLQVSEDDEDTVVCSWIIPNNATQLVGQLQFLIRFACVNNDTGVVEYVWNTAVYTGISVSSGIYNANSSSDNIAPPFNFVTTISGQVLKFFVGTKAEYDALPFARKEALFAIITDDTTKDDLFQRMDEIDADYDRLTSDVAQVRSDINDILSGDTIVPEATHAVEADKVNNLNITKDANGIITIDGVVIPQKTLLFDGEKTLTSGQSLETICEVKGYETVEVYTEKGIFKTGKTMGATFCVDRDGKTVDTFLTILLSSSGTLYGTYSYYFTTGLSNTAKFKVYKVYGIIE